MKVKEDLGPDAIILQTRTFKKGGFFGFFAKEYVEVWASLDATSTRPGSTTGRQTFSQKAADPRDDKTVGIELGPLAPSIEHVNDAKDIVLPKSSLAAYGDANGFFDENAFQKAAANRATVVPATVSLNGNGSEKVSVKGEMPVVAGDAVRVEAGAEGIEEAIASAVLVDEVAELKGTVGDLKLMLETVVSKLDTQPRTIPEFPTLLQGIYERLLACDVSVDIAKRLTAYLQKEHPHLKALDAMADALEAPVADMIRVAGPLCSGEGRQRVVALVGPTGVGKTTTIAKLAANFALTKDVKMAMLTIDTYRVAAIEQLKIYGDIIGLPVEVILTPQNLKEALKRHADKELILIDTAGRSPQNRLHINELRSFLDVEPACECHLVLSASTRLSDLRQILKSFSSTGIDRIIVSKTDETEAIGGVISIANEANLPISYITTGQSVPDDIQVAEASLLTRMLIQELKG